MNLKSVKIDAAKIVLAWLLVDSPAQVILLLDTWLDSIRVSVLTLMTFLSNSVIWNGHAMRPITSYYCPFNNNEAPC